MCIMQSPVPRLLPLEQKSGALDSAGLQCSHGRFRLPQHDLEWVVATGTDREDGPTAFIREHNRLVAEDTRYVGSIVRFGTA